MRVVKTLIGGIIYAPFVISYMFANNSSKILINEDLIAISNNKNIQVSHVRGDKEFREFKTYVCQYRILKNPEEARMAGNVLNSPELPELPVYKEQASLRKLKN